MVFLTVLDIKGFTNTLCQSKSEKQKAYEVRYKAYLSAGFIKENEQGVFVDEYDQLENSFTFLLSYQENPIATIRACIHSPAHNWIQMPCMSEGFDQEIASLSALDGIIIEMNRLAVLPGVNNLSTTIPFALFANGVLFELMFDEFAFVCAAGRSHMRFYQRLGFKKITEVSPRPNAEIDLALMYLNPVKNKSILKNRHYFCSEDAQELNKYIANLDLSKYFKNNKHALTVS